MSFDIVWRGASKTPYNFKAYPKGTAFNAVSGVYILCREVSPGSWEALYVGETQSFHQRLNLGITNHDGYNRACRAGATHIAVMIVRSETQRLRIETDLRHGLNPLANRQSTSGGYTHGW